MTFILHNRIKGSSPYGEKYKSPTFKIPRPSWLYRAWKAIGRFFNIRIF